MIWSQIAKKKKKILKLFSILEIWLQSSQQKHNSDGINPTLISPKLPKKKKAFCIGELESTATTKKESNSMNERERMTYLIEWGPPPNGWLSLRLLRV